MANESIFEIDLKLSDALDKLKSIGDESRRLKLINEMLAAASEKRLTFEDSISDALKEQLKTEKFLDDTDKLLVSKKDIARESLKVQSEILDVLKKQSELKKSDFDTDEKQHKKASDSEVKHHREQIKRIETVKRGLRDVLNISGSIAKFGLNIATTTAKFGLGLATGTAGIAGYSINALADNAGNLRRTAQTLDSTPAEIQATENVYGNNRVFSSAQQTLSSIQAARQDINQAFLLPRLLGHEVTPDTKNADILRELPDALHKAYLKLKAADKSEQMWSNPAFVKAVANIPESMQDLGAIRVAGKYSDRERVKLATEYPKVLSDLNVKDRTGENYQDTAQKIDKLGRGIVTDLTNAFEVLLPEIQGLSDSFGNLIKDMSKSKVVRDTLKGLDDSLKNFDKWIKEPERKDILAAVMYDLDVFGGMIYSAAEGLGGLAKLLGFTGEKTLKATEYHQLLAARNLQGTSAEKAQYEKLADHLKEALENPQDSALHNEAIEVYKELTPAQQKKVKDAVGGKFSELMEKGVLESDGTEKWRSAGKKIGGIINDAIYGVKTLGDFANEQANDFGNYEKAQAKGFDSKIVDERLKQGMDYFISTGKTPAQAAGIMANLKYESGGELNPNAVGDHGNARGIGQWWPNRQKIFKRLFDKSIKDSTLLEQYAFTDWEIKNTHPETESNLARTKNSAYNSSTVVLNDFEKPKERVQNAKVRGALAEKILAHYQKRAEHPPVSRNSQKNFSDFNGGKPIVIKSKVEAKLKIDPRSPYNVSSELAATGN